MRLHTHSLSLTAVSILAILLFCPALRANTTLQITQNPLWSYTDTPKDSTTPGPYLATIGGVPNLLVYCLDLHIDTPVGTTFDGYLTHPNTQAEDEAAFLAAYSLTQGAPSANQDVINSLEGPISMAIWQLMGTLTQNGYTTEPDPAAQQFINMANTAYINGQISGAFLSSVNIWNPGTPGSGSTAEQRFIEASAPEPGTLAFLGTGLLLIALSQIRRR
jgi:hypothetical protein